MAEFSIKYSKSSFICIADPQKFREYAEIDKNLKLKFSIFFLKSTFDPSFLAILEHKAGNLWAKYSPNIAYNTLARHVDALLTSRNARNHPEIKKN